MLTADKKLGNHPVLTPCYQGACDATRNFRPREEANSFIALFTKN